MPQPLVIAYHLIWTAYGWWLPNDPRGSGSKTIDSDVIAELGELHHGRKRVQPPGRVVRQFYEQAAKVLKHSLLKSDEPARQVIGAAFDEVIRREQYTCYACALMPDHVHVLIRKHRDKAEDMIAHLQQASKAALHATGARTPDHPVWGGPGWKVFQYSRSDVERTTVYIEGNPGERGLPKQDWSFVMRYDVWLPAAVRR